MHFFFRLFTSGKKVTKKISELENKITFIDTQMSEVKAEVKAEVIAAVQAAVKTEVLSAFKSEVKSAVKAEVLSAFKSEVKSTVKAEVKSAVKSLPIASEKKEKVNSTSIQIDHLQVDKIVIEHLDYANNFGQLGIKELSGKLNIGSTYEGDISEKMNEIVKEKLGKEAKVNFKAKKEL